MQTNKDKWLTDNAKVVRIQSSLLLLSVLLSIFFLKGKSFFNLIFLVMFGGVLVNLYLIRYWRKLLLCSGEDFERLEALCDKRTINAVFDMSLDDPKGKYATRHNDLMHNLLVQLTSNDRSLLSKDRKLFLLHGVRPDRKGDTLFALSVLSRVGDASTLRSLKRWKINHRIAKVGLKVQQAMEDCITAIKAREGASGSDSQLLRPSSSDEKADTYLRPIEQKPDEDAATLLRAEFGGKE